MFFILACSPSEPKPGSSESPSDRVDEIQATPTLNVKSGSFQAYSGLIPQSADEYLKMEQNKMTRSFAEISQDKYAKLPKQVDLSESMPYPGNQGNQNSCTGWAVSYAVKSFQENREHGWGLTPEKLFSPSFVYNQINEGKDEGATLLSAMEFVKERGTVPISVMPYTEKNFHEKPQAFAEKIADSFRSLGHRRIREKDVNQVRAFLASGEPVVMVIKMDDGFLKLNAANPVYKKAQGDFRGYHAMVAVGYDDHKKVIKVLNSWGEGWGDKGYGWVAYDFWKQVSMRTYVMYDTPTPPSTLVELGKKFPDFRLATRKSWKNKGGKDGPKAGSFMDVLLIVPNEAGITYAGKWLRMGQLKEEGKDFFNEDTAEEFKDYNFNFDDVLLGSDLFHNDKIGQMIFSNDKRLPIMTNRGITFGDHRDLVRQIYKEPDHSNFDQSVDTYFLHATDQEWEGFKITQDMSLSFTYDRDGKVKMMKLANVSKEGITGENQRKVSKEEKKVIGDKIQYSSTEGGIQFQVPLGYSQVNKMVNKNGGVSYFIQNPGQMGSYMNVSVDPLGSTIDEETFQRHINMDLSPFPQLKNLPLEDTEFAGIKWKQILQAGSGFSSGGFQARFYASHKEKLYKVQITDTQAALEGGWIQNFKKTFVVE